MTRYFSAIIMGTQVQGIVQQESAGIYLCQDFVDGGLAEDRHGYKYSYYVQSGSEEDMKKYFVRDFKESN